MEEVIAHYAVMAARALDELSLSLHFGHLKQRAITVVMVLGQIAQACVLLDGEYVSS